MDTLCTVKTERFCCSFSWAQATHSATTTRWSILRHWASWHLLKPRQPIISIAYMRLVYLPTFSWFFMVNVGKYTIHGCYGYVLYPMVFNNPLMRPHFLGRSSYSFHPWGAVVLRRITPPKTDMDTQNALMNYLPYHFEVAIATVVIKEVRTTSSHPLPLWGLKPSWLKTTHDQYNLPLTKTIACHGP